VAPAWEMQMATALQQIDGYQAVIPFNWVRLSILPFPWAIQMASNQLDQQVATEADQLAAQHPGDVVDINFIGHSRGNVVISETLQNLASTNDLALRGGYMQMTMLDPHPANNLYGQFSWLPGVDVSNEAATAIFLFQLLARDPQVIVPSNVMHADLFDQQTWAGHLFGTSSEILYNLWGERASALPNRSGNPIEEVNLTNVNAPGIGFIGHSEVHDWYLANIVDSNKTFT
jgi:hypothetical protein